MDFVVQLYLRAAVGLYLLVVSLAVIFTRRNNANSVRYALVILGASLWVQLNALNEYLAYAAVPLGWLQSTGGLVSIAVCYTVFNYSLHYPESTAGLRRFRYPAMLVALIGVPMVFHPDWLHGREYTAEGAITANFGWPYAFSSAACVVLCAGALAIFVWRLRTLRERQHRYAIQQLLVGLGIVLVVATIFLFVLPISGYSEYYYVGALSLWFFGYYSLKSVYKQGVIDFRTELRENARFLILFVGLAVPLTVVLWWIFGLVLNERPLSTLVFGILAGAIVLKLAPVALRYSPREWWIAHTAPGSPGLAEIKRQLTERPPRWSRFRSIAREFLDLDYFAVIFADRHPARISRTLPRISELRLSREFLESLFQESADIISAIGSAAVDNDCRRRLRDAGYDCGLPFQLPDGFRGMILAGTVAGQRPMNFREISTLKYLLEIYVANRGFQRLERKLKERRRKEEQAATPYTSSTALPLGADTIEMVETLCCSPEMQSLLTTARRYAGMRDSILITGETGVGKGILAQYIHNVGKLRDRELVTLDCTTIPAQLVESELFGHERGAFTGASRDHRGVFERASDTNLFLDEIGELSPDIQSKLLRVLQERTFYKVGGASLKKTGARFIFATNRDMEQEIQEGGFRPDLYYRIHVMHLHMPALRERRPEIPLFAEYYLRRFLERESLSERRFSAAAMDRLQAYDWPGNLRELGHLVHRVAINTDARLIRPEDLKLPENRVPEAAVDLPDFIRSAHDRILRVGYKDYVASIENEILKQFYENGGGNQSTLARQMQVERNYLRRKLQEFGLLKS